MKRFRVATYNRVSKREQSRDTDALVRQQWQTSTEAKELDPDFLEFTDVQTGRRDDRPEFQKVYKLIESKAIDRLIVSRIDRITRDLEMNARLAKLFEKTGVEIFEILKGQPLDFKNENDWKYFVNSGVEAEGESRRLSSRIQQTYKWLRAQGKPAGGGLPLGYRRSETKFIEPDPDEWEDLIAVIKILIECGGSTAKAAIRVREEVGWNYTRAGLYDLIRSPTIRGHTQHKANILFNTHPSVFDDPRLVEFNAANEIERLIKMAGHQRGKTRYNRMYPLSGLVRCGRCKGSCHIHTNKHWKYPDKEYTYICCGSRQTRATNCGGEYGTMQGVRGSINTPYHVAEAAVIDALKKGAAQSVDHALTIEPDSLEQELPEAQKLKEQIRQYEALNDPDLTPVIDSKRKQLRELLSGSIPSATRSKYDRDKLIEFVGKPHFWEYLTNIEKRTLFHEYVEYVLCDRLTVQVKLKF